MPSWKDHPRWSVSNVNLELRSLFAKKATELGISQGDLMNTILRDYFQANPVSGWTITKTKCEPKDLRDEKLTLQKSGASISVKDFLEEKEVLAQKETPEDRIMRGRNGLIVYDEVGYISKGANAIHYLGCIIGQRNLTKEAAIRLHKLLPLNFIEISDTCMVLNKYTIKQILTFLCDNGMSPEEAAQMVEESITHPDAKGCSKDSSEVTTGENKAPKAKSYAEMDGYRFQPQTAEAIKRVIVERYGMTKDQEDALFTFPVSKAFALFANKYPQDAVTFLFDKGWNRTEGNGKLESWDGYKERYTNVASAISSLRLLHGRSLTMLLKTLPASDTLVHEWLIVTGGFTRADADRIVKLAFTRGKVNSKKQSTFLGKLFGR